MRSFLVLTIFSATAAFACPDLTGRYARCQSNLENSENNTTDLVITQGEMDGVTFYEMTETWTNSGERETSSFPADGVTHVGEESPDGLPISANLTISCRGNEAVVGVADILMSGQPIGVVNSEFVKVGNKFYKRMSGNFMGQEFNEEVVCE